MEIRSMIYAIEEYKGFKTDAELADFLHISPQVLSKWIKKGSFDAKKIASVMPELSLDWLLSGRGEMLKKNELMGFKPVIPDELVRQTGTDIVEWMRDNANEVEKLMLSNIFPPYDLFYRVICDAMKPQVEKGDILALLCLKDKKKIINGECYMIDSHTYGFIIRRLYYKDGIYTCKSNQADLGVLDIPEEDVFNIFSISGLIRLRVPSSADANEKKDRQIEELIQQNGRLLELIEKKL